MIGKFIYLFGAPGVLTVLLWIAAAAALGGAWRRPRRERWLLAALGLALAGRLFAVWCDARAMEVRLDRGDEIRAAQEAQQKLLMEEEKARAEAKARGAGGQPGLRFAEDAPGESLGHTIMTPAELSGAAVSAAGNATSAVATAGSAVPAYRAGGKQQRETGKVDAKAAGETERAAEVGAASEIVRMLKLDDYLLLNRLARLGRLVSQAVLAFCAATLLIDFLRRFNRPFDSFWPVPIAGRWLAQFSPPALDVAWPSPSDTEMERFLSRIVRKGHAFLYFGSRAARVDMCRLRAGRWGCWRLPLLRWGEPRVPRDAEFLLDAAWFGRYAICVDAAEAETVLADLAAHLHRRQHTRASAPYLPHLVWDKDTPIPADLRPSLAAACRDTGVRLVETVRRPE